MGSFRKKRTRSGFLIVGMAEENVSDESFPATGAPRLITTTPAGSVAAVAAGCEDRR